MDRLRRWLSSAVDVRAGERRPAALMFLYGFLAMSAFYVLKPVRNSVFIDRVGAENLPYVYILTALAVTVLMLGYTRWSDRLGQRRLLRGTFAVLLASLAGFWVWLGRADGVVASGAFYVWGKAFPLLLVSQFWLVANLLFTTRQARRLFAPIGLGLVAGGAAGSAVTGAAASTLGTENLLLVSAGLLAVCAATADRLLGRAEGSSRAGGREEVSADALELIRGSSHLRAIALILALTVTVGTLVDWQFNRAVELFVQGEDARTAFYGRFFATLNVASVAVQLLLTGLVLRRWGIGLAMLALPVLMTAGSVGVAAAPVLLAAAALKGSEGALRYSLDQSTRELLYLPVPTEVKTRVKPFLDLAVQRGATGLAGVALLVCVQGLGFGIREVALLSAALAGAWGWATFRMREEYRDSIKRLIGARDVDLGELIVQRLDAGTLAELREALDRGTEEQVLYALSLLEHQVGPGMAEKLADLLDHGSPRVRARALSMLSELDQAGEYAGRVQPLLADPDHEVRVEAVYYLCAHAPRDTAEQMSWFLRDPDREIRTAAVACTFRYGSGEEVEEGVSTVRSLVRSEDVEERRGAARLLSEVREHRPETVEALATLLRDDHPRVRKAAIRAAGETTPRELVPDLLARLRNPEDRREARRALAEYGAEIHGEVLELMRAGEVPRPVWVQLPRLLVQGAEQRTVDRLTEALGEMDDPALRYQALKTLDRLRRDRPDLAFSARAGHRVGRREIRRAYRWAAAEAALRSDREGASLLVRTLAQRRREATERALRGLALQYDPGDLYVAHAALTAPDTLTRQQGFELLDNLLEARHRRWFDPLADPDDGPGAVARAAVDRYRVPRRDAREWLRALADDPDPWVSLTARRAADPATCPDSPAAREVVERLRADAVAGLEIESLERGMLEVLDRAERLAGAEIFSGLRIEDLARLAALAEDRPLEAGQRLLEAEARCEELLVLVEGRLTVGDGGDGDRTLEPIRAVGHLSLLDGRPVDREVRAEGDGRVLAIRGEAFFDLLEERFPAVESLLAELTGTIRERGIAAAG